MFNDFFRLHLLICVNKRHKKYSPPKLTVECTDKYNIWIKWTRVCLFNVSTAAAPQVVFTEPEEVSAAKQNKKF